MGQKARVLYNVNGAWGVLSGAAINVAIIGEAELKKKKKAERGNVGGGGEWGYGGEGGEEILDWLCAAVYAVLKCVCMSEWQETLSQTEKCGFESIRLLRIEINW